MTSAAVSFVFDGGGPIVDDGLFIVATIVCGSCFVIQYLVSFLIFPVIFNEVARTLKSDAYQRETTGSSRDSLQLCPFSKWELLLKDRMCSQGNELFPL